MLTTDACCMFCKKLRGLETGWVRCPVGKPKLLKTAHFEDNARPATMRDKAGLWWRESIVDLTCPRTCFSGEVEVSHGA